MVADPAYLSLATALAEDMADVRYGTVIVAFKKQDGRVLQYEILEKRTRRTVQDVRARETLIE